MTRGRRNNVVTLPTRDEPRQIEQAEGDEPGSLSMVMDLAREGHLRDILIKAAAEIVADWQTDRIKASDLDDVASLNRKLDAPKGRYYTAMARCRVQNRRAIFDMVIMNMSLVKYGRERTGNRIDNYCKSFALDALRVALEDLYAVYQGEVRQVRDGVVLDGFRTKAPPIDRRR
jgi:hypothetical protein